MSSIDGQEAAPKATPSFIPNPSPVDEAPATADNAKNETSFDAIIPDDKRPLERFIPVTRFALLDRLTAPSAWPAGQSHDARRFFRYLDHWRRQQYNAELHELEETYEPFSPDSDLLMTRKFTPAERAHMQKRILGGMSRILEQANYVQIDPADVELILTRESAYNLDLHVDLDYDALGATLPENVAPAFDGMTLQV